MFKIRHLRRLMVALATITIAVSANGQPTVRNASKSLPYSESFDSQNAFNEFLVINNGGTWSWYDDYENPYARCYGSDAVDDDAWLATPTIHLEQGRTYSLQFKYRAGWNTEKLVVAFGTGDQPSTYTQVGDTLAFNSYSYLTYNHEITPSATGDYRIGLHAVTTGSKFYIAVDDISLTALAKTSAPDSVTAFIITPGAKGTMNANVSLKAPTQNIDGSALNNISKIDILRNDTVVSTFTDVTPGQNLSRQINGGLKGNNKFAAIAYSGTEEGRKAEKDAWLGIDVPGKILDVRLIDNGETYSLEWSPVGSTGAHGGYVDPENVTYNVYDFGETQIANGLTDTEFVDDDATPESVTGVLQYYISATNEAGTSALDSSNYVCTGKPIPLPFSESFANGRTKDENLWWWQFNKQNNWQATSELSFDHDNGSLRYWGNKAGDEGWLNTGKLALKNVASPYLSFAYYAYPGTDNKLEVIASKMQNEDVVVASVDFSTLTGDEGWRRMIVPVNGMSDVNFIILKFHAIIGSDADVPVVIDAIELKDRKAVDLAATSINAPDEGRASQKVPVEVRVTNEGSNTVSDYCVKLFADGEAVDSVKGVALNGAEDYVFTLNYQPAVTSPKAVSLNAVVSLEGDENLANNTTINDTITVVQNTFMPSTTLTGNATASGTTLNWTAISQEATVTETFDEYDPWLTSCIGPWTTVDGDGAFTYGINGSTFKHQGDPFAYIVFNPDEAGLAVTENPMIAPHSGNQFLASLAADSEYAPEGNNDWIISPELNGEAQTVTIWAKSLFADDGNGGSLKEHFKVLTSTNGNDVADFTTEQLDANDVPDAWTEYSVEIPAGTKYFAIHNVGAEKFMLMLDDITYSPKPLTVKGYNIYRDSTLIATVPATTLTYTDGTATDGAKFQVSVVYEEGESALSNVWSTATGIDQISTDVANNGRMVISTVGGAIVYSGKANSVDSLNLQPGLYVVKVGNKARKVVIK